ncbi:MAG: hypothetical protein BGO67_08370 [Alphaproteobacteria bacterium 41-28]|nr:MAG: hypothetical protein BGO67_08370 [Alphaproteobacteria bacterium 41-28]
MKYLWVFVALQFIDYAKAEVITVTNVKVSVTDDSSATAREKALERAHDLAFQKLLNESFPEKASPLPPHDRVMNMVTDFSIDREKTTPTSYTASLTFQFDGSQVQTWLQQKGQTSPKEAFSVEQSSARGKPLKMYISYTSLIQWQDVKKVLETFPGVQKFTVLAFSLQNARVEVAYCGSLEKLQQHLLQKGYLLSPQEEGWIISSNGPLLR